MESNNNCDLSKFDEMALVRAPSFDECNSDRVGIGKLFSTTNHDRTMAFCKARQLKDSLPFAMSEDFSAFHGEW